MSVILGISAYYHDSAAAILVDGELVAAAQEERFTRIKHDNSFPTNAITYVMQEARVEGADITYVAFYEKPFLKFERLLETYYAFAPRGLQSFLKSIPQWIKDKLYTKKKLENSLLMHAISAPLFFPEHHLSHASSAFFPSPYEEAAILTLDGVGEWSTMSLCYGNHNNIEVIQELHFPHSLGLLYSSFTYYCGFEVNEGEYKLMGLAPYSNKSIEAEKYIRLIKENLIDIHSDGSFVLNMRYFDYATNLKMVRVSLWQKLFGFPPRKPESEIKQSYIELAYAIQSVLEEVVLKLQETAKRITNSNNLVLAGGVALNCTCNGKLKETGLFKNIWIQPAAGDAGGAIGAAMAVLYIYEKNTRIPIRPDSMSGMYLGPSYTEKEINRLFRTRDAVAVKYEFSELTNIVASLLNEGAVVGWFQGRMEFGPRALGNRSILADPRCEFMQKKMNLKIKFRESFRPFAPAVLEEDASLFFKIKGVLPYMLMNVSLKENQRIPLAKTSNSHSWQDMLYIKRSKLQAVTHVDYSARIQTVSPKTNLPFYNLLLAFKKLSGVGVLVNTSFNVRGEPIVCTPFDAYDCFLSTDIDYLVIENFLFSKIDQPVS